MANGDINTIASIRDKVKSAKISYSELATEYIELAKKADTKLNLFVNSTYDEALTAAKRVDVLVEKSENSLENSSIQGIPTALKDNFNWTDTKTTASSKILDDYISPYNATVTERMLQDSAVILGKTNMDAFAHGSSTETSDYGVTYNPYGENRVSGGSSGGSAAIVAAGAAVYAIGSETAGSVRGPASWCGLYGFAPTYGRISRYGVVAMGSSLDRPGVLANSVMDCALVTDVIAGQDANDATTIPEVKTKYASNLNSEIKKQTLGIPKQFLDERIDSEVSSRILEVVKSYEKLGYKIKEIDLLDPKFSIAVYTIICRSEVSSNLARIDGIRYGHFAEEASENILDQIALNRGEGFGNEAKQRSMTGAYALSAGYYDAYYKRAQRVRTLIIEDFKRAFTEVDLIVGPTMPTVAPKVGVTKNNPLFGELADVLTEPSALAGLPCITVPVGVNSEEMPIGFQIFGPQFAEQEVLDLAYVYEQKLK